ncbi:hypothetical protein QBC38DRAFT_42589 [Podospora fimiseda]|uniref:Uncharacterized protein n=1 Tax=Podospora fimiseda TaxID=252190 RepID=A0AAN7GPD2_9PEZI|nr:hypothetical protein QBC38DRAFT_42589 [Podospora fimiseda]
MDHNDGTARSDGFKPLDDSPSKSRSRTSFRFSRLLGLSSGDSSDTVDDSPVATADSVETEDENNTPLRSSTPLPGDRDQPPSSTSTKQGLFIASPRRHSSTAQGSSRPGGSESTVISSGLSTTAGRSSVDHGATFGASFAKNRDHTAPGRPSAVAKDSTSHDENHITTARRFATGDQPSADRGSGLGASFTTDGNYQPFRRSSNDTTVGSDSIAVSVRFPGSAGRPHISSSLTDVSSLYSARRPSHARHRSVTSEGNITGTAPTDRRKFATAKSSDDCHNITLERRPSTTHFNTASHEFRAFSEGRSTSVCLPSSHGGHTDSDIGLIANRNSTDNRGSLASRRYPVAGNDDDDFLAFHPVFRPVFRPVHWSADYTNRSDAHQAQHSANDEGTTGIPGSFKISRYSRADTSSTAARTGDTSATLTTAGCSLICRASETGRRTPTSRDFTPPSTFTAYQRSQEGNDFTIFGRPGASNTPNPMKNFGRSLIRPPSATGTKPNDRSHCNSPTANTEPIPDACHRTTRSSATRHVTGAAARSIALESSSTLNTNTGHYSTEWASSDRAITTAGSSRIPGPSTDDDQATCYGSTEANVIPMKRRYASNQSSSLTKHRSSATASSQLSQDIRPTTKTEPAGTITRCLTPRIPGASIQPAGKKSPDDQELFEAGSRSSDDGSEATASVATRILAPCRGVTGTSRTGMSKLSLIKRTM